MKIFTFLTRNKQVSSVDTISQRFPVAGAVVVICTTWLLYLINAEISGDEISRGVLICGTVFFFSLGMSLYTETLPKNTYTKYLQIIPILYGIAMYYTGAGIKWDFESNIYLILHLAGFVGLIFIAPYITPYLQHRQNEVTYTNYFSMTSWGLFMAAVVGVALLVLGLIGITSVIALFDLNALVDEKKIIANWVVISLACIAPLYALTHLPRIAELDTKGYQVNKFFGFLIRFVGLPFIYIYFIILYAYSIRVLINFSDWPNGMISWMVIGFSAFGYINYIFSKAYEADSKHVSLFRKYFPLVVLPQTVMLFYAIYLRIDQYDITMNRYFVVIFGIWLVIVSLYLIVSKKKSMSLIPASLALISFVISIGPWSVFSFPLNRQYDRLVVNLEKAKILQNGVIVPLQKSTDIDKALSSNISSGISYVCNYSDCELIRNLFPEQTKNVKSEENYNIPYTVTQAIRVEMYNQFESKGGKYLIYNLFAGYNYNSILPLELPSGYTKIVNIYGKNIQPEPKNTQTSAKYPYITLDPDASSISYHRSITDITTMPLTIPAALLDRDHVTSVELSDLTFTLSHKDLNLKLYFQEFSVKNPNYTGRDTNTYYSVSGMGLVQEK